MSEPKLWVDIPNEKRLFPAPNDKLPDFVLLNPKNTLIAFHGRPTWESLEYCVLSAQRLSTSLGSLTTSIRRECDRTAVKQEVAFLQDVVLAEHDTLISRVAETVLPSAIASLDDIFVPWTRFLSLRSALVWVVQEMAKVGEVLEKFVERGMKKRLGILRSSKLFQEGVLESLRSGSRKQIDGFEKDLSQLLNYCKGGGRFNVAPDGTVRSLVGVAANSGGKQDPQVALDEMFKQSDDLEYHDDVVEMAGLGPRRSPSDLAGGAVVIRLGNGPGIII